MCCQHDNSSADGCFFTDPSYRYSAIAIQIPHNTGRAPIPNRDRNLPTPGIEKVQFPAIYVQGIMP